MPNQKPPIEVITSKGVKKIILTEKPRQAGKKMQFIGIKPGKEDEKMIIFGHELKTR